MIWARNKAVLKGMIERPTASNGAKPFDIKILLCSDVHFDNPHCRRDLFLNHLSKVDHALIFGDFYCLMEGKGDPRGSKNILPAHLGETYIDNVIEETIDALGSELKKIRLLGYGNHETSVRKHKETDVIERTATLINQAGGECYKGGYGGVIHINTDGGGGRMPLKIAYHHGKWGGVVTKGTLASSRYGLIFPDVNIVVSGHTHDHWLMEIPRFRYDGTNSRIYQDAQIHLKTGTYKDEITEDMEGWAIERMVTPKSVGKAWILTLYLMASKMTWKIEQA